MAESAVMPPVQAVAFPPVAFQLADASLADALLVRWGHYLGPCNRPFGRQDWVLALNGEPLAVATSASIVSASVAGYGRGEIVELARLCSAPEASWATRVMLRLWREVGAQGWPYWPVQAAVAYSQNIRHPGNIYRFDGWERISDNCGSNGGGAWSRKRYAGDAAHGRKTLWLWRYGPRPTSGGRLLDGKVWDQMTEVR